MQTTTPFDRTETDVVHYLSLREPEFNFQHSYEKLIAAGVRKDIAHSLAAYATFQGEEFDFKSPKCVHVHEEVGQEPHVQGRMAA